MNEKNDVIMNETEASNQLYQGYRLDFSKVRHS